MMQKSDWLEIGLRLLGFWSLMTAIDEARMTLDIWFGFYHPISTPVAIYQHHAVEAALVGIILLLGAGRFVKMFSTIDDVKPSA